MGKKVLKLDKCELLRDYLLQNIEFMEFAGGQGRSAPLPDFDFYSLDYLGHVERLLQSYSNGKEMDDFVKSDCITNLKRAIDCQCDIFLHALGIYNHIKDKSLSLEKKLDFLQSLGVFNTRSLNLLNSYRNKMEHKFKNPKIEDLNTYFDLTSAFIFVVQGLLILIDRLQTIDFEVCHDNYTDSFSCEYNFDSKCISVEWYNKDISSVKSTKLVVSISDYKQYGYFLKIHIVLCQLRAYSKWSHVFDKIKILPT